jgi:hypothetical protein
MRLLRIGAVVTTVMALGLVGLLQVAGAAKGGEENPHQWLVICHRTHSATNPFVVILTAEEAGIVAHKAGGPDSPQPPGHEGDIVFGPFTSHSAAQSLAAEGTSICEEEVTHGPPPTVPPAVPPTPAPGAPSVTG